MASHPALPCELFCGRKLECPDKTHDLHVDVTIFTYAVLLLARCELTMVLEMNWAYTVDNCTTDHEVPLNTMYQDVE